MSDITVDYVTCSMQIVVIVSAVYVLRLIIPRRDIVSHAFVLSFGTLLISSLTIVALLGDSAYVGRTSRALATAVYDVFRSLRPAEQRHDLSIDQSVVDDSEQTGLALNLLFGSIAEHLPMSITANHSMVTASVMRTVWWSLVVCIAVAVARLGLGLLWWSRLSRRSPTVRSERLQKLVARLKPKMRFSSSTYTR